MFDSVFDVLQIIFADILLSGDNALIIGMAAAGLPQELRRKAIVFGMMLAAGLRIFFAVIATYLLQVPGILFFGGLLLAVVCWRFYREMRHRPAPLVGNADVSHEADARSGKLSHALTTIIFADVSMSIDNVLAVAAIARDDTWLLVFGLALAIIFMAFFATVIMRVLTKYTWLSWLGLAFLVYLTVDMLEDGWPGFVSLIMSL